MSLETHLRSLISENGPLSIATFMTEALNHPLYGYYHTRDPFGVKGDFTTSPEICQIFGELIGAWLAFQWQEMGEPKDVALVELGPGRGTLAKDLLRGTENIPGFHDAIELHLIDTSDYLKKIQKETLAEASVKIHWHQSFDEIPQKPMLLIANELFDALPVHQYILTDKGWCERKVGINDEETFFFALSPATLPPGLPKSNHLDEGSVLESSPACTALMQDIATHIKKNGGAGLVIDYGYTSPDYQNTLQAVKEHEHCPVLSSVGNADITAHVDFSTLAEVAADAGVNVLGPTTQERFLCNLGIELRLQMLLKYALAEQKETLNTGVNRLIAPSEMGTLFRVLGITQKSIDNNMGFENEK